ncbi:MAG: PP2C family protein-serine/threonine phosphatase [Atopobiaceae bacterium]|nr:PP2C family protein-serine/threonine phosphatase [Atopobiaceae bacterium]
MATTGTPKAAEQQHRKAPWWRGLLQDEPTRRRAQLFVSLSILSASMTFTQLGFIGLGSNGRYVGYLLGLLAPIAATSLLLGARAGALQGLFSGAVQLIHARLQPLDLFEAYFVSFANSVVLYVLAGFLLGLLFGLALRHKPTGALRAVYLALSCFATSLLINLFFTMSAAAKMIYNIAQTLDPTASDLYVPSEWVSLAGALGNVELQVLFDALLLLAAALLTDYIVSYWHEITECISVRTAFGSRLLAALVLVFCVVQAVSFVLITRAEKRETFNQMGDELSYLHKQIDKKQEHQAKLSGFLEEGSVSDDMRAEILDTESYKDVFEGYDLSDGTIVLISSDGVVLYSDNDAYPAGINVKDLYNLRSTEHLDELSRESGLTRMVYDIRPYNEESLNSEFLSTAQLGYMRVLEDNGDYIMMAKPSSMVFANRRSIMVWTSLLAFALVATVYVLASQLLGQEVVGPIVRTNTSLAKITAGDLNEVIRETGNVEFTSLSSYINSTVASLKDAIAAESARIARDLATAKAIQSSALPRVFPPFPDIEEFDIFASMDPAKEVGGDFFDFFLIDDHTLGFLIADVSGKGIPGALFMMAAKAEIENHLSTGKDPANAIALANRYLCANNDAGMFVTVWAATLDLETGLLTYVNAGHNFPLLRHGVCGQWEWLQKKCGLFLGTFDTATYRQEELLLTAGDELMLYTDGVNEAFDINENEYGNDRLEAFLAAHNNLHPRELVHSLRADVAHWAEGAEQSDDVTILALEYLGQARD